MKELTPAEFIADLYELKHTLIRPTPFASQGYIEPNMTVPVLETLIALFYDKYDVDFREVELHLKKRSACNTI